MSTLEYLNTDVCCIGKVHPVWNCGTTPYSVTQASTKARLLVQRYGITSSYTAGKTMRDTCPLCNIESETMQHFLIKCEALEDIRSPLMSKITTALQEVNTRPLTVQTILDPSIHTELEPETRDYIESLTRRLCHELHSTRSVLIKRQCDNRSRNDFVPKPTLVTVVRQMEVAETT